MYARVITNTFECVRRTNQFGVKFFKLNKSGATSMLLFDPNFVLYKIKKYDVYTYIYLKSHYQSEWNKPNETVQFNRILIFH